MKIYNLHYFVSIIFKCMVSYTNIIIEKILHTQYLYKYALNKKLYIHFLIKHYKLVRKLFKNN